MPKKFTGANSKVTAAAEKKAAAAAEKDGQKQAAKEVQASKQWKVGAKDTTKQADADAKRQEKEQRRREAQAQLDAEACENAQAAAKKTAPPKLRPAATTPKKKAAAAAPAMAVPELFAAEGAAEGAGAVESFAASNIDDALDLMGTVGEGAGRSGDPAVAAVIDRHPERRAKAAFRAYEEREIPRVREENPGLRLTQIRDLVWKAWQKAGENPFNQAQVAHNATQDDVAAAVAQQRQAVLDRLRID
ncbi:hypothetical protein H4R26_005030 [Coemansia thaxteri]|uniref:DUF1014-domain-containing protein n=1 Tax=Coemansia thaxteri TaxID=2663907 RepID=A0A9W8BGA8_9FUNG|nr:hypothetical protein H4R26_005030 [Coemansia thaxteri]